MLTDVDRAQVQALFERPTYEVAEFRFAGLQLMQCGGPPTVKFFCGRADAFSGCEVIRVISARTGYPLNINASAVEDIVSRYGRDCGDRFGIW